MVTSGGIENDIRATLNIHEAQNILMAKLSRSWHPC